MKRAANGWYLPRGHPALRVLGTRLCRGAAWGAAMPCVCTGAMGWCGCDGWDRWDTPMGRRRWVTQQGAGAHSARVPHAQGVMIIWTVIFLSGLVCGLATGSWARGSWVGGDAFRWRALLRRGACGCTPRETASVSCVYVRADRSAPPPAGRVVCVQTRPPPCRTAPPRGSCQNRVAFRSNK